MTLEDRLSVVCDELMHLSEQVQRIIALQNEINTAIRGRPFVIHNLAAWEALLDTRNGVFLRLVSWAKKLCAPSGFLQSIEQTEFPELQLGRFEDMPKTEGSSLEAGRYTHRVTRFLELFPLAMGRKHLFDLCLAQPDRKDLMALAARVGAEVTRIEQNRHRAAHPYGENGKVGPDFKLDVAELVDVATWLQRLVKDFLLLHQDRGHGFVKFAFDGDDPRVQAMVDLVFFGTPVQMELREKQLGLDVTANAYQRREALFARLHASYDEASWRGFNDFERLKD